MMCILLLLGQWQYISKEFWKENIIKLMFTAVIPIAIITNITKFIIKINSANQMLMSIALLMIATILLIKIKNIKQLLKACGSVLVGMAIFTIFELFTLCICKYTLKIDIMTSNLNPLNNFLIVMPERVLQYGILLFIYFKKNALVQINLLKTINQNKTLKNSIIINTIIEIIVMWLIFKFILIDNILKPLSFQAQEIIILLGLSLLIYLLISNWIHIIIIYPDEIYKYKKLKEEINYEKENDD